MLMTGMSLPIRLLDRLDEAAIFGCREGEGAALASGAAGAADAVDVILGVDRHVEIEDVRHALDVEAARRDVAGDEEPDLAVLEALERLGALRLRHVAVQRRGVEAVLRQRAEAACRRRACGCRR